MPLPEFHWNMVLLGCLGGVLPDVLRIVKGRHSAHVPKYLTSWKFWAGLILLVAIGGLAAWLFEATEAKEAVAYGFTAPEVISKLVAKSDDPEGEVKMASGDFDLRAWWSS